jgi:superfamily II DNA/RNA helicase
MDYIEQGKLSVAGVKFFVLDEADRLLDTGSQVRLKTLRPHRHSCGIN